MDKKTVFGLDENLAGALAYAGMFITGIVVFVAERENKFVRFCALQSFIFFAVWTAILIVVSPLNMIPIIGGILPWLISTIGIITWVYLAVTAFLGKTVKIPILGDVVWEQVNK